MMKVLSVCLLIVLQSLLISADPSAVDLVRDVYSTCLQEFSVSCVQPKARAWFDSVIDKSQIKLTEDLVIVKKDAPETDDNEDQRSMDKDILDKFEDFIQTHDLLVKTPEAFSPNGVLGSFVPRNLQTEDLKVPLAVTGRSKLVKKVIVPFLLGLKFKTAVLVPLALALIAMKTWKALTLGLLSIVLTGALMIFKLSKPKVNYEVIHIPQHVEHHVDHVEHAPVSGWEHPSYARQLDAQEMAYNAYIN